VPPAAVEIRGLVKAYGGRRVVDDLSLVARAGEVTAVLGPNGAGKTTTVECCEGLRAPDGGAVRVLGLDPATDAAALRGRVGVMLQDGGLPAAARALDVLRHVATMYAVPRPVTELAGRLGIDGFARTPVRRLSGGQRQRLALATAVVGRPELAFLDEPSAGLDPQGRVAVWELVTELRATGTSVVLTTHLMDEAEALADVVAIVDHGRVIACGSPAGLVVDGSTRGNGIRFTGPPRLGPAMARDLGVAVREARPGVYWATTSDGHEPAERVEPRAAASLIAAIAGWAAGHGALLTGFTLGPRTLEDVFLDLTGRELR
jgi:ABC-2 type transport system ATP-binding protein